MFPKWRQAETSGLPNACWEFSMALRQQARSINKVSNAYKSSYFAIYMLFHHKLLFLQGESLCWDLCDRCPSENLPTCKVCLNGCEATALYKLHCYFVAVLPSLIDVLTNHSHMIKLLLHIATTYVKWTTEDF